MTSSPSAATRCWPRKSSPAPVRPVTSSCRCGRCSNTASWAFAEQVRLIQASGSTNKQPPIDKIDRSQAVPLSYSQQRMWFLWQMEPDSPAYNVGGMARLRGVLDVERFEAALQALIMRHETLRTTFPSVDGVARQQVHAETGVRMDCKDFTALDADGREWQVQQLADDEAHTSRSIWKPAPLLRACLVKTAEQEHYLVLTLHHIVTEGWAMDIFARELSALYEAFVEDRESPLAPLPVQYLDYSVWQRQWLESGERQRQLDYWTTQLGREHPLLELPADRPRPPVQSHQGELYRFDLSDDLAARVRAFNAQNGLTLFMTMTAALATLLYRYSGQTDLRIGAPVANRIRPESEGLIGAFLNTQVLRCQLDGQMSVGELFEQVRHTVIEGQSHQDLPFDHLVEALQPPRSARLQPAVPGDVQRAALGVPAEPHPGRHDRANTWPTMPARPSSTSTWKSPTSTIAWLLPDLQHRSVRRAAHCAHGRALAQPAGGADCRSATAPQRVAVARRR